MQVVEYRDRLLPDLRRLANRHLALLTPGWELTERQLASVLRDPFQYGPYFREEPWPGATEIVCVMDRERLVAAAALWLPDMDHGAPPRIDGLALEWREDPEVPEWAKRGVTDALLQVCLPDPAATRFHEAMGFSVIETGSTYRKDGLQGTAR